MSSFQPGFECLNSKELLSTVILADIDTGVQVASFQEAFAHDGLLQQYSTLNGNAAIEPGYDHNPNWHGTVMAELYASLMDQTGDTAYIQPIVACSSAFDVNAIARAMMFVATEQSISNVVGNGFRFVVSVPASPGWEGYPSVWSARRILASENIAIVYAAGNTGLQVIPGGGLMGNEMYAEALKPTGGYEPYSNHSVIGTAFTIPVDGDGTSGATIDGAAWVVKEIEANPGIDVKSVTFRLHQIRYLPEFPHLV